MPACHHLSAHLLSARQSSTSGPDWGSWLQNLALSCWQLEATAGRKLKSVAASWRRWFTMSAHTGLTCRVGGWGRRRVLNQHSCHQHKWRLLLWLVQQVQG